MHGTVILERQGIVGVGIRDDQTGALHGDQDVLRVGIRAQAHGTGNGIDGDIVAIAAIKDIGVIATAAAANQGVVATTAVQGSANPSILVADFVIKVVADPDPAIDQPQILDIIPKRE